MKITINPVHSFSSKGIRPRQEDSRYPNIDVIPSTHNTFCVCDGVGGSSKGHIASDTVSTAIGRAMSRYRFNDDFTVEDFRHVIDFAYDQLDREARCHIDRDMATTMTMVTFNSNGCTMAHIGDSRIYHLRHDSGVLYRSEDHSLVNQMVHRGMMTPEEAEASNQKNVITRYMEPVASDETRCMATLVQTQDVCPGDVFFLCTDGVYGCMDENDMISLLLDADKSDEEKMSEMQVLCTNSEDNFTATLITIADVQGKRIKVAGHTSEVGGHTARIMNENHVAVDVESDHKKTLNFFEKMFKRFYILLCLFAMSISVFSQEDANIFIGSVDCEVDTLWVLQNKAKQGDLMAQKTLAEWYFHGTHEVAADTTAALQYWALAGQQDDTESICHMAECYRYGWGTTPDSVTAIKLYEAAVKKGELSILREHESRAKEQQDIFSALLLSECYLKGIGVKRNTTEAREYTTIAANAGHPESQFTLGLYNLNSDEEETAFVWFMKAAAHHHSGSLYYCGLLCESGLGTDLDKAKAMGYYQQASDYGFPMAQYQLGRIFLEGDGVTQDPSKAIYLLSQAAMNGNTKAMWLLATCYAEGVGVVRDFHFATQWMAEAIDTHKKEFASYFENKSNATFATYLKGMRAFNEHDFETAVKSFKAVSKANVPEGRTMLALCYADSTYVKSNCKRAFKLMKKAACKSVLAKYHLSTFYRKGIGTKRDVEKSLQNLETAAEGGIAIAQCELGLLYMTDGVLLKDMEHAAVLFLDAESQYGLTKEAAIQLAECYRNKSASIADLSNSEKRIKELQEYSEHNNIANLLNNVK